MTKKLVLGLIVDARHHRHCFFSHRFEIIDVLVYLDHPTGKIGRKSFRKILQEALSYSKNPVKDVAKVSNIRQFN